MNAAICVLVFQKVVGVFGVSKEVMQKPFVIHFLLFHLAYLRALMKNPQGCFVQLKRFRQGADYFISVDIVVVGDE